MRPALLTALAGVFVAAAVASGGDPPAGAQGLEPGGEALPVVEVAPEPVFDPAEVRPLLSGAEAQAAAAVDAGRGAQALGKLPADSERAEIRFLRGRALAQAGRHGEAIEVLQAVAPQLGALEARAHCVAAESLESLKRWTEAAEAWGACIADPGRTASAQVRRAAALGETGQRAQGLEELAPLLAAGSPARAQALATAARLQEAIGQRSTALETWRTLFVEEPLSPLASEARQRARALVSLLKASDIETGRLVERIERLVVARHTRQAAAELRHLTTPSVCPKGDCWQRCLPVNAVLPEEPFESHEPAPFVLAKVETPAPPELDRSLPACAVEEIETPADPVACKAQLLRGWVAQRVRASSKALPLLRDVYARCEDPDTRATALFLAVGAASRLKDPDAEALALILGRQFPASSYADDALLAAAERARDRGAYATERRLLEEIAWHHWQGDQRAEALFRLFWSHRREGRPERGLFALQALSDTYDAGPNGDGGDAERGRYWWGRTVARLAEADEREQGVAQLATLARERPLTYYGLLSASWLEEHGRADLAVPMASVTHTGGLRPGALGDTRVFELAGALLSLGLDGEAREVLLGIGRSTLEEAGPEASLIVAELLAMAGDARMSHYLARRDLLTAMRDLSQPLARRVAEVAYPLVFRQPIVEWSVANGFDPNLLQGLMREESALDPRARSPVGARGLTQVMPATGKEVASRLKLRNFKVDDLWDPDTNIRIGSWYLGRMLERFKHPGLAAAAYNAGPGNLGKWLSRGMPDEFDAFVEEIPFDETRGYVKRVLRSYAAYGYLSQERAARSLTVSTAVVAARQTDDASSVVGQ